MEQGKQRRSYSAEFKVRAVERMRQNAEWDSLTRPKGIFVVL